MFRYCKWCDNIRIKSSGLDEAIKEKDESGRTVYKLKFRGDNQLYCYKTGKIIKNEEKETCSEWEEMDCAF